MLAAGRSSRMGSAKPLLDFNGTTLLERALRAAAPCERLAVVLPPELIEEVLAAPWGREHSATLLPNLAPERGMTHSLRLANDALGSPETALAVLLVDTPLVDAALVAQLADAREAHAADVAFPVRDGQPGHPVVFGPRARARLATLPDGDTLQTLRDDPRLVRLPVPFAGDAPFLDLDTPEALAAALASHVAAGGDDPTRQRRAGRGSRRP
ncbi:MAG: nucleotidyltransferase family protein [Vulcanimicrobiaceae bacterium]